MNGGKNNILKFLGELPNIEEVEILSIFSEVRFSIFHQFFKYPVEDNN